MVSLNIDSGTVMFGEGLSLRAEQYDDLGAEAVLFHMMSILTTNHIPMCAWLFDRGRAGLTEFGA